MAHPARVIRNRLAERLEVMHGDLLDEIHLVIHKFGSVFMPQGVVEDGPRQMRQATTAECSTGTIFLHLDDLEFDLLGDPAESMADGLAMIRRELELAEAAIRKLGTKPAKRAG